MQISRHQLKGEALTNIPDKFLMCGVLYQVAISPAGNCILIVNKLVSKIIKINLRILNSGSFNMAKIPSVCINTKVLELLFLLKIYPQISTSIKNFILNCSIFSLMKRKIRFKTAE